MHKPETDHLEEAGRWEEAAEREASNCCDGTSATCAANAQAHAQIAIATELRGIREALEGGMRDEFSQALTEIVLAVKQGVSRA